MSYKKKHGEEIDKLKQAIDRVTKEAEDYKNKYLRALADYQNFEKRVNDERLQLMNKGKQEMIIKLLPFLDGLEKAAIFIKDPGLKQIKDSLSKILTTEKIEEIDVLDKQFDPHLAEAVEVVSGEKDNRVVEVVRKGYKLGDKVLRVAQVKVSKKVVNS